MKLKIILCMLLSSSALMAAESEIDFNRQIRPILSDKCFYCHGPDAEKAKGKLQLHSLEAATKLLGKKMDHAAITPGNPQKSALWHRINTKDEDDLMPPPDSNKTLSEEEKQLLEKWIASGAKYDDHWSYSKLKDSNETIDSFLKSKLSAKNLSLNPDADKRTLIRRLSLDLRGLPPSLEEIQQFLNDSSSNAYEKMVERFLADKHYGERMAVFWLDLVRFTDSVGYHGDQTQKVYPYRDYVINSFNSNKKFDLFTREQLAGDLMPNRTDEQLVASCYNRLNMMTQEGGAQPKEYIAKYGADRVRTTTSTWLGSTLGCAECHDHKYDPFTAKDFYSFKAFFADVKQVGRYGGDFPPLNFIRDEKTAPLYEQIALDQKANKDNQTKLIAATKNSPELQTWLQAQNGGSVISAVSINGAQLTTNADGSIKVSGNFPESDTYEITLDIKEATKYITLEVMLDPSSNNGGFGPKAANFVLSLAEIFEGDKEIKIKNAEADYQQNGFPIKEITNKNKKSGWAVDGHREDKRTKRLARMTLDKAVQGKVTVKLYFEGEHKHHQFAYFKIAPQTEMSFEASKSLLLKKRLLQKKVN
jgi:hypothetical protein